MQYLCNIAPLHLEVHDSLNLAIFVLQDLSPYSPQEKFLVGNIWRRDV